MGCEVRAGRRIAVIDGDEWRRRGLVDGLRELGGVIVVAHALTHEEAAGVDDWSEADIVLVSASTTEDHWDRFGGINVAAAIKQHRPREQTAPKLVLLCSQRTSPLLPIRAAEAGIDFIYPAARTLDELERLVLAPDLERTPARSADYGVLRRLGLLFSSRLNAGLGYIQQQGLTQLFSPVGDARVTRRGAITVRQHLAELIRIQPAGGGTAALANRTLPSWKQLRLVVDAARGVDRLLVQVA